MKSAAVSKEHKTGKIIVLQPQGGIDPNIIGKIRATGKLVLPTVGGFECLSMDDILYLQAQGNYTAIQTRHKKYLFAKTLKTVEVHLPAAFFYRPHRSFIVNMACISAYYASPQKSYFLLDNGFRIPVSKAERSNIRWKGL